MSLAAMAVGSLYLKVPPRIAGTTRALAAGSRMALPTWKRCKPRSRPRRSSLAPISAQFRSPAMPENHKLGDWKDLASREPEHRARGQERGAKSEATRESFLSEGGEETLRQRAAVSAKDSHRPYPTARRAGTRAKCNGFRHTSFSGASATSAI
jgi:hypothetical protein